MALDYLPIQGSAVTSKRALSHSGFKVTTLSLPNGLTPEETEGVQILKDAYRNGAFDVSQ